MAPALDRPQSGPRRGPAAGRRTRRRRPRGFEPLEPRLLLSGFVASSGAAERAPEILSPDLSPPMEIPWTSPTSFGRSEARPSWYEGHNVEGGRLAGPSQLDPAGGFSEGTLAGLSWVVEQLWQEDLAPPEGDPTAGTPETNGPHSGLDSAQDLASAHWLRVDGRLTPGDGLDLYRVPIVGGEDVLRLGVQILGPWGQIRERVLVLDEAGRLLDDRAVDPSSGYLVLLLRLAGSAEVEAVYVGIYRPEPGDGEHESAPAAPEPDAMSPDPSDKSAPTPSPTPSQSGIPGTDYWLFVLRSPSQASPPTPPAPPPSPGPGGEGVEGSPPSEVKLPPPDPNPTNPTIEPAQSEPTGTTFLVVAGNATGSTRPARPSASRSASPAGGRLSRGPATRPVDRRTAAVIDLALLDLSSPRAAPPKAEPTHLDVVATETARPRPPRAGAERAPAWVAALRFETAADAGPKPSGGPSEVEPTAAEAELARLRSRVLVGAGLGFAYALTFTFLLPDLDASLRKATGDMRGRSRLGYWRLLRGWRGPRVNRETPRT